MAISVWAHPSNYRNRVVREGQPLYDYIVIHCTDGKSYARPIAEMWQDPSHGTSAHFVIDQDGTTLQCVPLRFAAQHAHDMNSRSVGIEHCARTPGEFERPPYNWTRDPGLPPSEAQYAASARLVAYLLVAGGLPPDRTHVVGHAEIDKKTTHDRCPEGCGWRWDHYMAMVADECRRLIPRESPVS
jgi:N-acetyl-anhydromuramyl-L-alanine amidase AmpD